MLKHISNVGKVDPSDSVNLSVPLARVTLAQRLTSLLVNRPLQRKCPASIQRYMLSHHKTLATSLYLVLPPPSHSTHIFSGHKCSSRYFTRKFLSLRTLVLSSFFSSYPQVCSV